MKKIKDIAKLLLQPALTSIGGPCKDWESAVRLFSGGLLTKQAESATAKHLKTCTACRLFLMTCFKDQEEFIAHHILQTAQKSTSEKPGQIAFRLGKEKDAFIGELPASKTQNHLTTPKATTEWDATPAKKGKKGDTHEKH